ncbi:MAG: HAD superfamily hydrolase (TIGR01549 family) [Colwellia sp.]
MLTHKLLGVIFDLDNTLVTSSLNFDRIRADLGCPKDIDLLDFVDSLPQQQKIDANKLLVKYETIDAVNATKLAGTDQLLALLSELDLPCAIVTRNCHQAALLKIQQNNINIPTLLTRENHKAKPAPDALLHIAKCWKTPPENLLYVGDYLYDLQAARNANTMSCLVTYGETMSYADLATIEVNDLTELSKAIKQLFVVEDA